MELVKEKYKQNILKGKLSSDLEDKIIPIQKVEFKELSQAMPSGLKTLDDMFMGGFRDGQLILISGISGFGKTQLSLQITKQYSEQAIPVVWFSYEMPLNELQWRFKQIGGYDDLLCYVPKENISDNVKWLEDKIVESIVNYYTKIVFVDNLDFITVDVQNGDDKLTMQKRIIGMLKRIAIEYEIIIFLNAHIVKLEEGREPRMQNIYGASEAYKLSDAVIFIHRLKGDAKMGENIPELTNISKIIVDKNRLTGKLGQFKVIFKDNKFSLIDNTHKDENY